MCLDGQELASKPMDDDAVFGRLLIERVMKELADLGPGSQVKMLADIRFETLAQTIL